MICITFTALKRLALNDLYLISGLGKRDKLVFDYIFNYYYSALCAYSLQYLHDRNQAEDIVQDFFVMLWMEAPRLKIKSSLKSYLFASVKNKCLDFQKHEKVDSRYRTFVLHSSDDQGHSADQYFSESELRQIVERSLDKLPPRCREIFEMSRFKGLSNQEISDRLSISKRTVELQISNSLKILRKELVEFLPAFIVFYLLG